MRFSPNAQPSRTQQVAAPAGKRRYWRKDLPYEQTGELPRALAAPQSVAKITQAQRRPN